MVLTFEKNLFFFLSIYYEIIKFFSVLVTIRLLYIYVVLYFIYKIVNY